MKLKDKKIRFIAETRTVDDHGFASYVWQPVHSGRLWAYYRQLSGSEFFASATVNETEEVLFVVNYRTGITTDMLVEYKGQYYEITRIDDFEGYKDDLSVYCKLAQNQNIEVVEPETQEGGQNGTVTAKRS